MLYFQRRCRAELPHGHARVRKNQPRRRGQDQTAQETRGRAEEGAARGRQGPQVHQETDLTRDECPRCYTIWQFDRLLKSYMFKSPYHTALTYSFLIKIQLG